MIRSSACALSLSKVSDNLFLELLIASLTIFQGGNSVDWAKKEKEKEKEKEIYE